MPKDLRNPVFDELFDGAVGHVLGGTHQCDEPPVDGGRWPVTIVARPPLAVRQSLEQLMRAALRPAGPGHFATGREDAVHLTIRALEPYRDAAAPTDPIVEQWDAALARACAVTEPLQLTVTGVTMSSAGVMAQVETLDDQPWEFMDRLRDELGELAWFEDRWWVRRNIWYATLVHFAAGIADPRGLVDWVSDHRRIDCLDFTVDEVELVRSRYVPPDGPGSDHLMRPERWLAVPLKAVGHCDGGTAEAGRPARGPIAVQAACDDLDGA